MRAHTAHRASGVHFECAGVLVEIVSGEGGDDSKLFAEQLFTAYLAYLNRNSLAAELEETGPRKFSFVCADSRATAMFANEIGCHCVQLFYVQSLYLSSIWEEKHYTEQKKNSMNRKETEIIDIINNTNIGYKSSECDDIGSEKENHLKVDIDAQTYAMRGRPKRIAGEAEKQLCKRYKEQPALSYKKLAIEYSTNDCTIRNTLMRNGIIPEKRRMKFAFPTTRFWKIRSQAKRKGIYFDITMPYLQELFEKQNGKCAYTGWQLTFPTYCDTYDGTASLDRIDSKVGYVIGNVHWVHKDINMMKQQYSHERFLVLCKAVVSNNS